MRQFEIPAVFMRGGSNKALVFHRHDLRADQSAGDDISSPPSAALTRSRGY
jgi:2-methylaconitate cis-trans-isomerase PrpF